MSRNPDAARRELIRQLVEQLIAEQQQAAEPCPNPVCDPEPVQLQTEDEHAAQDQ